MSNTSDAAEKRQRCAALRKDGQPCQALATHTGLCIAHSPESPMWRAKGGASSSQANRAVRLMPRRLQPLVIALERVFGEVERGERTEKNAQCLVAIAVGIARLVQAGEMEERMRELERLVHQQVRQDNAEAAPWWGSAL